MIELVVKKGRHDFRPKGQFVPIEIPWILPSRTRFIWEFEFTEESFWESNGDNDLLYDWSKGGGMATSVARPGNWNSGLWAFRTHVPTGEMEVGAYFNRKGGIIFPQEPVLFTRKTNETQADRGRVEIWRRKKTVNVLIQNLTKGVSVQQSEQINRSWFSRRVGAWFGGNKSAPQEVRLLAAFKVK